MGYSTAFIVGAVMPWGGREEDKPKNWEVCDGRPIDATTHRKYQSLYETIGTKYGGTDSSDFRLPDIRGNFIRGTADGSDKDPERGDRTALYAGGNTGDQTGSYQDDAFKNHRHSIKNTTGNFGVAGGNPTAKMYFWKEGNNTDVGNYGSANESRPDNYATIFLIKVT